MRERVDRVVAELRRRQATVFERVRCPKCGAPVGVRCRSMPRGWRPLDVEGQFRELRHPHWQRLEADGIRRR